MPARGCASPAAAACPSLLMFDSTSDVTKPAVRDGALTDSAAPPAACATPADAPAAPPPGTPPKIPPASPDPEAARRAPYPHQVGGHGQLVVGAAGTIEKPLVRKEADFYSYLNSDVAPPEVAWLLHFTPRYLGQRTLSVEESRARGVDVSAMLADVAGEETARAGNGTPPAGQPSSPYGHLRWASGSSLGDGDLGAGAADGEHRGGRRGNKKRGCPDAGGRGVAAVSERRVSEGRAQEASQGPEVMQVSPWAVQMASRTPPAAASASKVIVLGDINQDFRFPCVFDIKCGLRHYDDDATPAKRERHIRKAQSTTTAATGIRYIGLQSLKGSVYEFRDKYHGRKLKEEDLVPQARWFFHNGSDLRTDSIELILEKLRLIAQHMETQNHFMFYSSSLLLVYEGDTSRPAKVDVRMIDFAHTQRSNGERDSGYITGIRYLIGVLETVLENNRLASPLTKDFSTGGSTAQPSPFREPTSSPTAASAPLAVAVRSPSGGTSASPSKRERRCETSRDNPPSSPLQPATVSPRSSTHSASAAASAFAAAAT